MSTTPTCDLTPSEMFDSLTGFEEIAVAKMFGRPITDYGRGGRTPNPFMLVRALIAVHHKRVNEVKDAAAYAYAMGMTAGETQHYFEPEPDDEPQAEPAPEGGEPLELGDDEGKAPRAE